MLILEGSIVLENDAMPPTRYGPGDVIFFKDGAYAKWHVESRVRKLAFCRKTKPNSAPLRFAGVLQDQEDAQAGPQTQTRQPSEFWLNGFPARSNSLRENQP